jgi:hypothetical protein
MTMKERRFRRARGFRFNILASIFGASVAIAPITAAAAPAKPLPPEVRAYFDKARQECRQAGDKLHVTGEDGFAETADFNGDGKPDYIVQMASLYCPSLGASEYCGSAGCQIAILVSQGDRLREAGGDNYQGFAITKPVGGKQSLAFAAHGTFCGHKSGADTCFGTMSWTPKGFKTTYTAAEPAALKAALTAPPTDDGRPDKNPKYDWKFIGPAPGEKGASIAMSDGSPDRTKVVVACADKVPALVVSFPPGAEAPPSGMPIMLEIGDAGPNSEHADVVLKQVQDKPAYIGQLPRNALAIMQTAGSQQDYAVVPAAWTVPNRDYWIDMPPLPLTHFNETSQAVLNACAAGLR